MIATTARDAATRVAAVEAIARMGQGAPQRALLDLLPELDPNDPARRALLPLLRPENLADPMVRELIALLDAPSIANDEKEQIAMTLAMLSLRDGWQELAVPMSTTARALIERMTQIALRAHAPSRS